METLSRCCVLVLKRGAAEDIEEFAAQVALCEDKVLVEYQKHILLPHLSRIQNGPRDERLDLILMDSLRGVIKRLGKNLRDASALNNVFLTNLMFICSPREGEFQSPVSDDLKISFFNLMTAIFSDVDEALILEVYTGQNSSMVVAPLYKVFVDCFDARNRELKLNAIRCLTLSYLSGKRPVVDVVKGFLPGIVCGLLRQVMDYSEKSQRIFNASLTALTDSITLVMSDRHDLDEQYYGTASQNLYNCASTLRRVACPPHMKECESSCKYFAEQLLRNCSSHLEIVIPVCLEILLTLEKPNQIRTELFAELLSQTSRNISVEEKFSEYFDQLFSRMPKISAVGSKLEKLSLLRQLHGLLKLNPNTIFRVLNNPLSRRKFFSCLHRVVALDRHVLRLSAGETYNEAPLKNIHRQINWFDEEAYAALEHFCRTFGRALDCNLCRDLMMENLRHDSHYSAEAALIFALLIGNVNIDSEGCRDLIEMLLDLFPTPATAGVGDILCGSFVLLALGDIVKKASDLDIPVLLFLLAQTQSEHDVWRSCAYHALFAMPQIRNNPNLEDLICECSDEISSQLSELATLDAVRYHDACRGLLEFLPARAVEDFESLFDEIIHQLSCGNELMAMTTFGHVVRCLQQRFPPPPPKEPPIKSNSINLEEYAAALLKNEQEEAFDDEDEAMDDSDPSQILRDAERHLEEDHGKYSVGDEDKPVVPIDVRICKKIVQATVNFQSGDLVIHTKAFTLTADCFMSIEAYEEELLPLVHTAWEALIYRLKSSHDFALSVKALNLLSVLCRTSRGFVASRIISELWPRFCVFLKQQKLVSQRTPFADYRHSSVFKYQLGLLNALGDYAGQLELSEEHLSPVLAVIVPYLLDTQPEQLQEAAGRTVNKMSRLSPECVQYNVHKAILERNSDADSVDNRSDGGDDDHDNKKKRCHWCTLCEQELSLRSAVEEFPALAWAG